MKNTTNTFLKYLYISANVLLALYILVNTSFLQTTLFQYLTEQSGLTKTDRSFNINQTIEIDLQSPHIGKIVSNSSQKPANTADAIFLLAVMTFSQLFPPRKDELKRSFREALSYFKRFIEIFRRLLFPGDLSLRAPPISA